MNKSKKTLGLKNLHTFGNSLLINDYFIVVTSLDIASLIMSTIRTSLLIDGTGRLK